MHLHIPPVLRHRRFLLLWLGLMISLAGSQMQVWALFWHIRTITPQPIALIGAADAVNTIIRNTIRQLQTPDYIRGRMVSINQIFFMGGPQLGEVEAGVVAQHFGAPTAIISGGIGCLIAVAWTVKRWPFLLKYNGDEPIIAGK